MRGKFGGANFKLQLQFIFLLVPCYFRISACRRVCRRHQGKFVSSFEESFIELPVAGIEHAVGVQQAEITFVGLLGSPEDRTPVRDIVFEYQVCQIVVDKKVPGDCQPCWPSPAWTWQLL